MTDDPHVRLYAAMGKWVLDDLVYHIAHYPEGWMAREIAILRRAVRGEDINMEALNDDHVSH